ncbi:MAG TPA: polysaccharide biosynthesis protein [Symbiobacteriaceae bacterium]|nr:polysaccharide biosynthesis protein [Symbiobacteriaceae bacterium]
MSQRESLLKGAAALAVAGLFIKISNLLVRVPLTRLITAEGLGIYQMALPAFYALYHLAAGGVPVAVQNLVAEYAAQGRKRAADQVLTLALQFTLVAGGLACLVLLLAARPLAHMLGEDRIYWSLLAVAPAILLAALDSIYRNYLQGLKRMTPTATAQTLEQATKMVATILGALWLAKLGREYAAAGAALGITAGCFASLLYMAWIIRQVREQAEAEGEWGKPERPVIIVRRMIRMAWPVTIASVLMPLLNLIDVGLVQRGFLSAGYEQSAATTLYGAYSGIAVQMVWFPVILTNALGNALGPVLTAAQAAKQPERVHARAVLGLRATAMICLPVAVAAALLSGAIAQLFAEPTAARPLALLAPVAFLGPLTWLMTAYLQALGRTGEPMRNLMIGMAFKLALDGLLAPIRGIDVLGVAFASVMMFTIASLLNGISLANQLKEPLPWSEILGGPTLASIVMGGALFLAAQAHLLHLENLGLFCGVLVAAAPLYVGVLLLTGAIKRHELAGLMRPFSERIERIWPF